MLFFDDMLAFARHHTPAAATPQERSVVVVVLLFFESDDKASEKASFSQSCWHESAQHFCKVSACGDAKSPLLQEKSPSFKITYFLCLGFMICLGFVFFFGFFGVFFPLLFFSFRFV